MRHKISVFIREKCGTIDNTALSGYWKNCRNNEPKMCTECNKGKWHDEFPKKNWKDYGIDKLLELESYNDGSMINATEYLKKIAEINHDNE